jgi:hypothetical protein
MKKLKSELNKYIDGFFKKHNKLPTDEILNDFKKGHRKFYLQEYEKDEDIRKRINLSLRKEEFDLIDIFAKKYKKTKSAFCKEVILKFINQENVLTDNVENKLQKAIIQLRKIGNNINQLTKLAHQQNLGSPAMTNYFNEALRHLAKIEKEVLNEIIKKQ